MRILPALLSIACFSFPALAADPPANLRDELKPLDRFAGSWEKDFEVFRTGATPEKERKTGKRVSKWILNDRHLQETGTDSDGTSYLMVMSHDSQAKQYRATFFQNTGFFSTMNGEWDPKSATFTWKDEKQDTVFIGTCQFTDADTMKMNYTLKDKAGAILFKIDGTAKRAKP